MQTSPMHSISSYRWPSPSLPVPFEKPLLLNFILSTVYFNFRKNKVFFVNFTAEHSNICSLSMAQRVENKQRERRATRSLHAKQWEMAQWETSICSDIENNFIVYTGNQTKLFFVCECFVVKWNEPFRNYLSGMGRFDNFYWNWKSMLRLIIDSTLDCTISVSIFRALYSIRFTTLFPFSNSDERGK